MEPLTPDRLKGTWSTLFLPFDNSGDILWDCIDRQLEALSETGVDGIYFNGTAGEFFSQSDDEFLRLSNTVAAFCRQKDIPFQIGAAHAHATSALRRIEQTRHLQPGAFQVILPEWTPLTWEEILGYLERILKEADPIPIVLYNPPYAQKLLKPEEWSELASNFSRLIGIKVAGGDNDWHQQMRPAANALSVFVAGTSLASGLIHGCASGSYSNVACLSPKGAVAWARRASSDPATALSQEKQIQSVFGRALSPFRAHYSNSALDKAMAACGGWAGEISPALRWPLKGIPDNEIASLSSQFRDGLPFLFEA